MTKQSKAIEIELLVLEAQAGNPKALPLIADRYHTTLTRRAAFLTNNPEAAHDIAQDTWLAIAKDIHSLRDPTRFHAWARSILANKARDWIKDQSKRRPHPNDKPENNPIHQSSAQTKTPNTPDHIRTAIVTLDPKLRDIVILIYMDRCTIHQAAAALAIPVGTAKSRLRKARAILRAQLESTPPERT
jgi:RNA polymerase sigma-70 factor (ECF subfamily)